MNQINFNEMKKACEGGIDNLAKKFGGKDDPKFKSMMRSLTQNQEISQNDYRNMFFANKFAIPAGNNYKIIEKFLKTYENDLLETEGLFEVPFKMDNGKLAKPFLTLARYCLNFQKNEIEISRISVLKTCTASNKLITLPETFEKNVKLIMIIKKDNDVNSYNLRFGDGVFVFGDQSFGTIVDHRFVNIGIDISRFKKRGKLQGNPLCESFVISIDFIPSEDNLKRIQGYIIEQDPRNPMKVISKIAKSAGNLEKMKDKIMEQISTVAEKKDDDIVEHEIATGGNLRSFDYCEDTNLDDE